MESFDKQLTAVIIFSSNNHFRNISFPCPLIHEVNMILKQHGLILTSKVSIRYEKI